MKTFGYAAQAPHTPLVPFSFDRRELRAHDVAIEILYCGVCHTDLHLSRNDWGVSQYPVVPGHEIVGRVIAVGAEVTTHRVGDTVAVGTIVDSCGACAQCQRGEQSYCRRGPVLTYNGVDPATGEVTRGGYAKHIVVRDAFVLRVPTALDVSRVGPLLCAGITTWSPLRRWGVGSGTRVAVAGLGGLGHLGVKFAVALGAEVTVITRSLAKSAEATALGAHHTLLSTDDAAMKKHAWAFDLVIDTIPVAHGLMPFVDLLDFDGTLVSVGAITMAAELDMMSLTVGRRRVSASGAGGIPEMQELLDFCAEKNVLPDTELITMESIESAFARMERGDIRYRFVLDIGALTYP